MKRIPLFFPPRGLALLAGYLLAAIASSSLSAATEYKIASGPDIGIRQIFEDADSIVLQFERAPDANSIVAKTKGGDSIHVRSLGRFIVLNHRAASDLTVQIGDETNRIVSADIFRSELAAKKAREEQERLAREAAERAAREAAERERLAREEAQRVAAAELRANPTQVADRAEYAAEKSKATSQTLPRCGEEQMWIAKPGDTLRDTVDAWSAREGWTMVWDAAVDYPISAPISFTGCYADALTKLFAAYDKAEKPLLADGHVTQKTLVVSLRK